MGMFDWWETSKKLDKQWLEKPTRPAPPMPTVSPYKAKGISEPVIKLLDMLSRDEWELVYDVYYKLVHVYDESIKLLISHSRLGNREYRYVSTSWMTEEEKAVVNKAVNTLCHHLEDGMRDWNNHKSREAFKKYLGD